MALRTITENTGWLPTHNNVIWLYHSPYYYQIVNYLQSQDPVTVYQKEILKFFMEKSANSNINMSWDEFNDMLITNDESANEQVPFIRFPTCEESFPFNDISNSYYVQVEHNNNLFYCELQPFTVLAFCMDVLCIEVPKQNTDGPIDIEDAQLKTAFAYDETRKRIFEGLCDGSITTSAVAKANFPQMLAEELSYAFDVSPANVSVNHVPCTNGASVEDWTTRLPTTSICTQAIGKCITW